METPTIGVSRDIYNKIFRQLEELIPGLTELEPGDYRKSESGGFMDLHLDVLNKTKEELRIALSHNYQQNGDTIADPDMEIRVYLIPDWRKAEALTYQDTYLYNEVYPEPGKVIPHYKKSLNAFLTQWLKNLKDQGHKLEVEVDAKAEEAEERPKCYSTGKVEIRGGVINADCLMCRLKDKCREDHEAQRDHEEGVLYHFGEGRLEEEDEDE